MMGNESKSKAINLGMDVDEQKGFEGEVYYYVNNMI